MWQMAGYYDESDDFGRGYSVAGFLGHQHDCVHLELAWRDRILNKYGIDYFKASELNSGKGQFARFRDNPNSDLDAPFSQREKEIFNDIKIATIDLILEFDRLVGIGAVLILPDYYRLAEEFKERGKKILAPYQFCAQTTMMESGFIVLHINETMSASERGLLRPVFDSHEQYSGRAKRVFDEFSEKNPITSSVLLPPHYEKDTDYLMLQAADNLAYECRRLLVTENFETHIPERAAMKRLKERVYKIYKLNYDALKTICESQTADAIPFEPDVRNPTELLNILEDIQNKVHGNERDQGISKGRSRNGTATKSAPQRDQKKTGRGKKRKTQKKSR